MSPTPRPATGRVFVIDDDPSIGAALQALLEESGTDVIAHDSPITAPFLMRAIDPDLVLLDLSMPALSGASFLQAGGRRALRTTALLYLFSGRDRSELARLTEELGADGFICKSDDTSHIAQQIAGAIERRRILNRFHHGGSHAGSDAPSSPSYAQQ